MVVQYKKTGSSLSFINFTLVRQQEKELRDDPELDNTLSPKYKNISTPLDDSCDLFDQPTRISRLLENSDHDPTEATQRLFFQFSPKLNLNFMAVA